MYENNKEWIWFIVVVLVCLSIAFFVGKTLKQPKQPIPEAKFVIGDAPLSFPDQEPSSPTVTIKDK